VTDAGAKDPLHPVKAKGFWIRWGYHMVKGKRTLIPNEGPFKTVDEAHDAVMKRIKAEGWDGPP